MKVYLFTLLSTALALTAVEMLTPEGERAGLAKHMRLLCALVWISVLIAPVSSLIGQLQALQNGEIELPFLQSKEETDENFGDASFDDISTVYFCDMLTQTLETRFDIAQGDLRCSVVWSRETTPRPERITLFLSGKAVWKDPNELESYVIQLLGCECITVIE